MKKIFEMIATLLIWALLLAGCSLLEAPDGTVEIETSSVRTRTERTSTSEETVYCSVDVKITNTSDRTIYNCAINAVATSDEGIDHYISLSYDVNIPPSQSLFVNVEWSLVRQVETSTEVTSIGASDTTSSSDSNTASSSESITVSSTTGSATTTGKTEIKNETNPQTSSGTSNTQKTESESTTTSNSTENGNQTSTTETKSSENGSQSSTTNNTSVTTTTTRPADTNEETDWNKNSVRILSYFFN